MVLISLVLLDAVDDSPFCISLTNQVPEMPCVPPLAAQEIIKGISEGFFRVLFFFKAVFVCVADFVLICRAIHTLSVELPSVPLSLVSLYIISCKPC